MTAPASGGTGGRAAVFALGLLIAVLLAVTAVSGYRLWDRRADEDARSAATLAARQVAVNTVSVDYQQAQQGFDRVVSGLTGEAKDTFAGQSQAWVESVTKAQTKSVVDKVNAGLVSYDDDSAEVIVSVSAVVTGPKVPQGVSRFFRYSMDVAKVGDRWLVSKIGLVP